MEFDRKVLIDYFPDLASGLLITLKITFISLFAGTILAIVLCVARLRGQGVLYKLARVYIEYFRTTPEMILIFWVYFCLPPIFHIKISAMASGILALSCVCGAFMAEILRAGIEAVPRGQIDACRSLSLPSWIVWTKIILPQAVRWMMPALINYFTELMKNSTLLAGIGAAELAYQAYTIGSITYRYLELLSAVAIGYFIIIFPISTFARYVEFKLLKSTGQ